jgi:hypothetical protein
MSEVFNLESIDIQEFNAFVSERQSDKLRMLELRKQLNENKKMMIRAKITDHRVRAEMEEIRLRNMESMESNYYRIIKSFDRSSQYTN